MPLTPSLYLPTRSDWRAWLEVHHASETRLWLIFYKKDSGQPSIPLDDAIEEALCFGWIDSLIQHIDEQRYARLFTPRKNSAKWSADNRRRVQKLIAEGRMTPAGLALIPADWDAEPVPRGHPEQEELPAFIHEALDGEEGLRAKFEALAPSLRRNYLGYILDAKREETRQKRLAYILKAVALGQTVDFMKSMK